MKRPTNLLLNRMPAKRPEVSPVRPEQSRSRRFLLIVAGLAIIGTLLWLAGCSEPLQAIEMTIDHRDDVHRTQLLWTDGQGWVRFETIDRPLWVRVCRQNGQVIMYRGQRLSTSEPVPSEAVEARHVSGDVPEK